MVMVAPSVQLEIVNVRATSDTVGIIARLQTHVQLVQAVLVPSIVNIPVQLLAQLATATVNIKIESGKAKTPFMQYGDRVKIEMLDQQGKTIFGSIEQIIKPFE